MAGLTLAGWAAVGWWWSRGGAAPAEQAPAAAATPLPPADDSPAFQGILDRTEMSPRDNAAYAALLQRVREVPWETLETQGRRDVTFAQLVGNPERYRGLPVRVVGTLKRVIRQDVAGSQIYPDGVYYEGYAITPDSGSNPWVLAFETLPGGLAVGPVELNQPITFVGYFLKLWAYEGGVPFDRGEPRPERRFRFAPLLIGRFPPASPGQQPAPAEGRLSALPLLVLGAAALYFTVRLVLQLGRLRRGGVSRAFLRPSVTETIEPKELSAWVEGAREEGRPDSSDPLNGHPPDEPDAPADADGLRGI